MTVTVLRLPGSRTLVHIKSNRQSYWDAFPRMQFYTLYGIELSWLLPHGLITAQCLSRVSLCCFGPFS
jgi:hypothetical protein